MKLKQFLDDLRSCPKIIKRLEYISDAIADPNGFGFLNFMLENAGVPQKYRYMFFTNEDSNVFLDCGMNVGLITDIARKLDMEVYGFEPNPIAVKLLKKKYKDDKLVHIYPCALSNKEQEMEFYINPQRIFDQSATICKESAEIIGGKEVSKSIKVPVRKLTNIIKNDILTKHNHIHLLKIDIEGSEFGVVNDIIDEKLYNNITYIVVETHERYFKDGKNMLKKLKERIIERKIKNIYLDWI